MNSGKPPTEAQLAGVMQQVSRYRITTAPAVEHAVFDGSDSQAQTALDTLCQRNALTAFTYDAERDVVFYFAPDDEPHDLGTLEERYGILALCCLHGGERTRLTPDEFRGTFPEFASGRGIDADKQSYLLDHTAHHPRLARVLLDSNAQTRNIIRKCQRQLSQMRRLPAFGPMFDQRLFVLALLTAEAEKAAAIQLAAQRAGLDRQLQVFTIPELNVFF